MRISRLASALVLVLVAACGSDGTPGEVGPAGPSGPQGPKGDPGAVGPSGPTGPAGTSGSAGAQGPTGSAGPSGPAGTPGAAGTPGVQGPPGTAGAPGSAGRDGKSLTAVALQPNDDRCVNGGSEVLQHDPVTNTNESKGVLCNGENGATGPAGSQGEAGASGAQGPQGQAGVDGLQGPPGLPGAQGAKGDTGAPGAKGDTGAQGPMGERGPQGPAGAKGDSLHTTALNPTDTRCGGNGGFEVFEHDSITDQNLSQGVVCNGAAGARGPQGVAGPPGAQGPQGVGGPTGPQGGVGPAGTTGPVGPAGAQGPQGATGSQGSKGDKGEQGVAGIAGPPGSGAGPLRVRAADGELVGYYIDSTNWNWTPTSYTVMRNSAVYKVDAWTGRMYVPWTVFYYSTTNCSGGQHVAETFLPQELFANVNPDKQTSSTPLFQLQSGTTSNIRVASLGSEGNCTNNFAPFNADVFDVRAATTAVTKNMAPPVRVESP